MKYFKYILILILFIFSFIYTNEIANVVKMSDPIMKKIISVSDEMKTMSVDAQIIDDVIVPGRYGSIINVDESYANMKKIKKYNSNLLVYENIIPDVSLTNIYDKYINYGNSDKRNVALIIYIRNDISVLNSINTKINLFLDSSLLINGKVDLNTNIKVYNGGYNNTYDKVTIEWMNDLIDESYNKSNYCLNINKNINYLKLCSRNKMYSINPILFGDTNIKKNIRNGSIIYFDESNINNINSVLKYLNSKGYNVVYLDELLSEK